MSLEKRCNIISGAGKVIGVASIFYYFSLWGCLVYGEVQKNDIAVSVSKNGDVSYVDIVGTTGSNGAIALVSIV